MAPSPEPTLNPFHSSLKHRYFSKRYCSPKAFFNSGRPSNSSSEYPIPTTKSRHAPPNAPMYIFLPGRIYVSQCLLEVGPAGTAQVAHGMGTVVCRLAVNSRRRP